jgi:hypothetical protein
VEGDFFFLIGVVAVEWREILASVLVTDFEFCCALPGSDIDFCEKYLFSPYRGWTGAAVE